MKLPNMSFNKMSSKLIIQKFEDEKNFQTLHITIEESSDAKFSVWQDGKIQIKRKEEKPRLVVKMVSDANCSALDLDSCSHVITNAEEYINKIVVKNNHTQDIDKDNEKLSAKPVDPDSKIMYKKYYNSYKIDNTQQEHKMPQFYSTRNLEEKNDTEINPLECCLEKVKKNNALIMENIHMLNRTLNYTKKKEILDIINPKPLRSYPCNACGKCFVYETGLRRHYSVRHSNLDSQPRWQFVWTCVECFQVWPRQDLAIQHAKKCNPNNIEVVQEIKTSSLLQCEFCEKVFTCIPRLLRHAKMHSVTNNYECNACDIAFSCYKTAEQHWLSCIWLKMCYQFSLPKMLLCNSCDRKFRNYDQLYNHRYKVGHFIPKISDDNNCGYSPILVYQCEVCGQWFNAISQLQVHRSQYHPHIDNGVYNASTSAADIFNNMESI